MGWFIALLFACIFYTLTQFSSIKLQNIEHCQQSAKYIHNVKNKNNINYSSQLEQCFVKINNEWKKVD